MPEESRSNHDETSSKLVMILTDKLLSASAVSQRTRYFFRLAYVSALVSVVIAKPTHPIPIVLVYAMLLCAWLIDEYRSSLHLNSIYVKLIEKGSQEIGRFAISYVNSTDLMAKYLLPFDPVYLEPLSWFVISTLVTSMIR